MKKITDLQETITPNSTPYVLNVSEILARLTKFMAELSSPSNDADPKETNDVSKNKRSLKSTTTAIYLPLLEEVPLLAS